MAKRRIVWYNQSVCLQQAIYSGLEYAFVSDANEQCTPFVLCKDFLHDAVYNTVNKTKKKIYGFEYNLKKDKPLSMEKCRLLLTNSTDFKFREKIANCLDFINQIEAKMRIAKTKAFECEEPPYKYIRPGIFLFEGSKRWLHSAPMVSMYSLLLRVGFSSKIGTPFWETIDNIISYKTTPYQAEDVGRLRSSKIGIKRIIEEGDRKIFFRNIKQNYPKGIRINDIHNNLGIIGFTSGCTEKHFPKWHEVKK